MLVNVYCVAMLLSYEIYICSLLSRTNINVQHTSAVVAVCLLACRLRCWTHGIDCDACAATINIKFLLHL